MEESTRKVIEERIDKRYRDSILRLEGTIRNTRLSNDKLSKQLFALTNRTINVSEKIGFASFDDFEEAVLDDPEFWRLEVIKENHSTARLVEKSRPREELGSCYVPSAAGGLREELEQLKCQVQALQELSVKKPTLEPSGSEFTIRSPLSPLKSVGNSSPSEISRLREQLDNLVRKYDSLVAVKESAENKYKEDYRKWRQFKFWLFNKSKHAKMLHAQLPKEFEFEDGDELQSNNEDDLGPSTKHNPSPLSNEENEIPTLPPPKRFDASVATTRFSNRNQSTRRLQGINSKRRLSEASHSRSQSASPSPTIRRRKKLCSDPPRPELVDKSLLNTNDARNVSSSSEVASRKADNREPINALFTIDTSKNNGLAFQYDEVVRSKRDRKGLEAGDCDCCKEYYNCLGPLPSRPALPWLSPKRDSGLQNQFQEEVSLSHKKRISRHRYQWSPAKTPPDYWNIGFPTTQQAAEINRRAAEIHADKRRRVEKEADTTGGRYVRREDN